MSIGHSDIWGGGGVDQSFVGTVLLQVLLRWMPLRLLPLVVAAVSSAAAGTRTNTTPYGTEASAAG